MAFRLPACRGSSPRDPEREATLRERKGDRAGPRRKDAPSALAAPILPSTLREETPAASPSSGIIAAPSVPSRPERKPSGPAMLLLHLHPRIVPEEALIFSRTFGLGGMALVLFFVLVVTGGMLLLAYEPSPERAYASVTTLRDSVPFGTFVRSIHHWAGHGMILVTFLHLLRVFYTGAFQASRRLNWILGLALMGLVMGSSFTGYLLPWDQLSYWAVTIGTGMLEYVPHVGPGLEAAVRGGGEVGPRTLTLFFVLHIAILPIVLVLLTSFHFWLVRKGGGVILPAPADGSSRHPVLPVSPHLILREIVVGLLLLAALLLLSAVLEAPLGDQANPGMSPNPAKAPWYFMGIQELLVHFHPSYAVLVLPLLAVGFLALLPRLAGLDLPTGCWFHSERGRQLARMAALVSLVGTPLLILADDFGPHLSQRFPTLSLAVSQGLVPTIILVGALACFYGVLRRRCDATSVEAVQAVFTLLVVGFVVLTVTGVFFRGEGMRLAWPWVAGGGA